jgi:hypothetical protein
MNNWAAPGVAVAALGVVLGSAPVVFIGAAIVLLRVVIERWPRRVLEALSYERVVNPQKTVVGDEVELRLSLWNRTRLPVAWAIAHDTLSEHLSLGPPA